jgi:hypothetical protein
VRWLKCLERQLSPFSNIIAAIAAMAAVVALVPAWMIFVKGGEGPESGGATTSTPREPTVGQILWVTSPDQGVVDLCLHAPSATPGERVITARCDTPATSWTFVSGQLRGPDNSCLTAVGDNPAQSYTPIRVLPCGSAAHQKWNVVRERAEIQNTSGGCLDAGRRSDDQRGDGSLVQMWSPCGNSDEENWLFRG